jgi:hypothetical protein
MAGAGWYPDPLGRAQVRYFDGVQWSQWAADDGKSRLDAEAVVTALPDPPDAPPPGMPPPPGTGWTPAQRGYAQTNEFRSVKGLSIALMWVLIGVTIAAVASAIALAVRLDAVERFRDSGSLSALQDVRDADDAVSGASSFLLLFSVAVFVLLIIYLFRAVKNTELWNAQKEKWTPGWAIGGWFIPVANLVIPFLTVRETWRRSNPDAVAGRGGTSSGLVWAWWLPFILGYIAIQIDPGDDPPTLDQIRVRDGFGIAGCVLLAISSILLIVLVRRLAAWQHQNAEGRVS